MAAGSSESEVLAQELDSLGQKIHALEARLVKSLGASKTTLVDAEPATGSCALRFQPVDKLAHDEGSVVTAEAEAVAQRDSDG
jgi:hypothetical protein